MALLLRRFREEGRSLVTWSLTVAVTSVAMLMVWLLLGNMNETARLLDRALADLPPVLRSMFGQISLANPSLFATTMLFGTAAPIVIMVFTAMAVPGIYTKDAGQGNLEFLFSLPIKRSSLAASRVSVFIVNLAVLHLILFIGAWAGALISGATPDLPAFASAAANAFLLNACLGGLIFLVSLFLNDYSRAILVALGVQMGLFLLNMGLETRGGVVSTLNPYHYYSAEQLLRNPGFPWAHSAVLIVAALVFWSAGVYAYIRKQV